MGDELTFYRLATENHRVQVSGIREKGDMLRAVIYLQTAHALAQQFGVEGCPAPPQVNPISVTQDDVLPALFQLEMLINRIYADNIYQLHHSLKNETIELDDAWQTRATTMLGYVRETVRKAALDPQTNDRIMRAIERLQHQIDRRQTQLQTVLDAFVATTAAVGDGAKNLGPAVEILERVTGAFGNILQRQQAGELTVPQLPSPDKYLPNGDAAKSTEDEKPAKTK